MKKFLSVVLMSVLVLSMAGCNSSTEAPKTTTKEAAVTTTTAAEEDIADTTTLAAEIIGDITSESEMVSEEEEKYIPSITDAQILGDGFMKLEADGKKYVYDISEKKMMEYSLSEGEIIQVSGSIAVFQSGYDYTSINRGVLNLETGEIMASLDTNGAEVMVDQCLDNSNSVYNYIVDGCVYVWKAEEKFSGNIFSFGVINDKGEWEVPLSEEYDICKQVGNHMTRFKGCGYLGEGMFLVGHRAVDAFDPTVHLIYDYKNDKTYNLTDFFESIGRYHFNGSFVKDKVYHMPVEGGFLKYYLETGETVFDDTLSNYTYYYLYKPDSTLIGFVTGANIGYLDRDFNLISKYSLDDYERASVKYISPEKIAFTCYKSNKDYFCIMKNDGEFCFEPIVCPTKEGVSRCYVTDTSCIVVNKYEALICDITTGEYIYYDYDACKSGVSPEGVDLKTGMVLMDSNDMQVGVGYYLADPADPDTLINPFEIAE